MFSSIDLHAKIFYNNLEACKIKQPLKSIMSTYPWFLTDEEIIKHVNVKHNLALPGQLM
jgi:hypothetical protein